MLLRIFLLVRWRDDAVAAPPRNTRTKADPNPAFSGKPSPFHDNINVVDRLSFSGDEGAGIGFLEGVVLVNGETDASRPLHQGMMGIEMQKIAVSTGGRDAQDILQGLLVIGTSRQRLNLGGC